MGTFEGENFRQLVELLWIRVAYGSVRKWPLFLQRKLLLTAKTYYRWVRHAQILWRKLSLVALKPWNSWMFSPPKVFRYTVTNISTPRKLPAIWYCIPSLCYVHCSVSMLWWYGHTYVMYAVFFPRIFWGIIGRCGLGVAYGCTLVL